LSNFNSKILSQIDYGYLNNNDEDQNGNNGKDALLDSKILKNGPDVEEGNEGGYEEDGNVNVVNEWYSVIYN